MHLHCAVLAGASASSDLDVRGHTDAEEVAVAAGPSFFLLTSELLVAGPFGDRVERSAVRPAVVRDSGECGEGKDVVGEEVLASQFDRVDTQFDRGLVDDAF